MCLVKKKSLFNKSWRKDVSIDVLGSGMKAMTAPKSAAAKIYFSFPEALRGVIPYFFALLSANSIINN